MKTLLVPQVFDKPALLPNMVLLQPVVLEIPAEQPKKLLAQPVVLAIPAKQPKKTPLELAREQVVLYEKLEAVEIEREYLKITLDIAHHWSSTKRLEMRDKTAYPWLALRNYSKENGYEVKKVFDQNYGHVNSYHKDVWFAVYEITID